MRVTFDAVVDNQWINEHNLLCSHINTGFDNKFGYSLSGLL